MATISSDYQGLFTYADGISGFYHWSGSVNTDGWSDYSMKFNFHRLNKMARISDRERELGKYSEPLDELRIKVAEWLS